MTDAVVVHPERYAGIDRLRGDPLPLGVTTVSVANCDDSAALPRNLYDVRNRLRHQFGR